MSETSLLEIAVPVLLRKPFHYLCEQRPLPSVGSRVTIPFGNRKLVGVVVGHPQDMPELKGKLKPIDKVLDESPSFDKEMLALLHWAAAYYHHPIGEVFQQALPVALRKVEEQKPERNNAWMLTDEGRAFDATSLSRSPKQLQALTFLQQNTPVLKSTFKQQEVSSSILNALKQKALIEETLIEQVQQVVDATNWHIRAANRHRLTAEQAIALTSINQQHHKYKTILLHGVTGSGKTEVYLQAMESCIQQGQQILVMVPEIGLTPQTLTRFEQRFDAPIAMLHSAMTDKQRLQVWQQARSGELAVVIGTRSSIFTPFKQLGMIIVDEEHDGSLKQQEGFRYHARDLANKRAASLSIPLILGTATPSLETLNHALSGRFLHLMLNKKAVADNPVQHRLIDCRQQVLDQGISGTMLQAVRETLHRGEQVMMFLNRRGFAPSLFCQECGWISECLRCQKPYTFHQFSRRQICHHCCDEQPVVHQCHQCGSTKINTMGLGTEMLELYFRAQFPQHSVVRIDRDTTQRKGSLATYLDEIHEHKHQIIIGTQMLAKGHHFANVTLVGIVDVDGALFSFDYRAPEKLAQLLLQVSGRAGREHKPGTVLLQTYHPDHPLLFNLLQSGYQTWAEYELQQRKDMDLPPNVYQAAVRAQSLQPLPPMAFLQQLRQYVSQVEGVEILGPTPAVMEKRAGKFRFIMILQSKDRKQLHLALAQLAHLGPQLREANKINWLIDVDPQEVC